VVASAFPLAQLVSYIGRPDVVVTDLTPPGAQPRGLSLSAPQQAMVRSAPLVIDVGDGYQPEVEAAAARARRHLSVLPAISNKARPYEFWLDPYMMAQAATAITASLTAADPAARRQFANGDLDFQSLASSIASDYVSSLSQCPTLELVTANNAFGRMAASFQLDDLPVSTAGVGKAVAFVGQYSLPAVFSEVGVQSEALHEVARLAGVHVVALDPMEVTPARASANQSYFAIMEANLTALEGPLACGSSESIY